MMDSQADRYEYGIEHVPTGDLHRWGMSRADAQKWLREWESDGGRAGAFVMLRRLVGDWERIDR